LTVSQSLDFQFGWLRGSRKFLKEKSFWLQDVGFEPTYKFQSAWAEKTCSQKAEMVPGGPDCATRVYTFNLSLAA
jgi:hypothetical protein